MGAHIGSLFLGVGREQVMQQFTHDVLAFGVAHYRKKGINVIVLTYCINVLANADLVMWWESHQAMGIRREIKCIQERGQNTNAALEFQR